MKTTQKTTFTVIRRAIRRAGLWLQIRALETTMAGREQLLPLVNDRIALASMDNLQQIADSEVRRLKRDYLA